MIDSLLDISRLLQYATILGVCGVVLSCAQEALVAGKGPAARVITRFDVAICTGRWMPLVACLGCVATSAWLALEAYSLAGNWTSWPALILHTRFGRITAARLPVLLGIAALVRTSRNAGATVTLLALIAAASFAWTGHGLMGTGFGRWLHVGCDSVHVLCASLWIGALIGLSAQALSCASADAEALRTLGQRLNRFSRVGPVLVAALAATGVVNALFLMGPHPADSLLTTVYGRLLAAKLVLFLLMLALAALNRLRLGPALHVQTSAVGEATSPASLLRLLRLSLLTESLLAAVVLAVVAVLGDLAPPTA